MASVVERLNSLVLSAIEIRNLTGWDDAMVEDYLNILRNLIEIASSLDSSDERIVNNTQLVTNSIAGIGKLKALVSHQEELINSVIALSVDNNKLRVRVNLQSKELINLQQSIIDDNKIRVRVNNLVKDVKSNQQQLVGW